MANYKSIGGRFNTLTVGLVLGFTFGIYMLKDYQLIKKSPPNPDNFDADGNWKGGSFINVRFSDSVAPLELKPEVKARMEKEKAEKEAKVNAKVAEATANAAKNAPTNPPAAADPAK